MLRKYIVIAMAVIFLGTCIAGQVLKRGFIDKEYRKIQTVDELDDIKVNIVNAYTNEGAEQGEGVLDYAFSDENIEDLDVNNMYIAVVEATGCISIDGSIIEEKVKVLDVKKGDDLKQGEDIKICSDSAVTYKSLEVYVEDENDPNISYFKKQPPLEYYEGSVNLCQKGEKYLVFFNKFMRRDDTSYFFLGNNLSKFKISKDRCNKTVDLYGMTRFAELKQCEVLIDSRYEEYLTKFYDFKDKVLKKYDVY